MKTIWRLASALLVLAMVLSAASCGGGNGLEVPTFEVATEETAEKPTTTTKRVYQMVDYSMADLADNIRILGERSHLTPEGYLTADWPCSGFEMVFETEGTDLIINFDSSYQNYYKVLIDGVPTPSRFVASAKPEKKTVAKAMDPGTHVVRVIKDGQMSTTLGSYCNITGVTLDGTILKADNAERQLFLEFVGDSVWCGGGALGNSAQSANYNNETSASAAVPYLVSEALNADYNVTARGSIGVVTKAGDYNMGMLYPNRDGYRSTEAYKPDRAPDAVIISLRSNDSKDAAGDFVRGGKALIRQIRSIYGQNVKIVWTYGMFSRLHMYTELTMIQEQMGGEANGVYLLQLSYGQNGSGSGTDNRHPSAADHQRNADIMVPYLKTLLGIA
ncbi:MAG: hypothetical protein II776_03310 [Clostridia bacterium]|nr:hypothetical protein [Clostridia bacterium]